MTVPNLLTCARLAATPVVAWLAYSDTVEGRAAALGVFIVATLTDLVDGMIARRSGQGSRLGLFLDPTTDKVLLITMFLVMADLEVIPLWMAILMMVREFVVSGFRSAAASSGRVVGAAFMGKMKAWFQSACVVGGLWCRLRFYSPTISGYVIVGMTGFTLLWAYVGAVTFIWSNRGLVRDAAGAPQTAGSSREPT